MTTLINNKAQTVQVKGINRLIDKYGHNCSVVTGDSTTQTRLIFGKSKASLESGTLINYNEYRLLIKIIGSMPAPLPAFSHVFVNGVDFSVRTVTSIGANAADPIVYEVKCIASAVPPDVDTIGTPFVLSPANNTSNFPYTQKIGTLYSVTVTSSPQQVSAGNPIYVGADWQIATDMLFTSVVASANLVSGLTYTTDVVLDKNTDYYVRVRHNSTGSLGNLVSAYSTPNIFSISNIKPQPVVDITTPTITNTLTSGRLASTDYYSAYNPSTSGVSYKVYLKLSAYNSPTGKVFNNTHWQISNSATFSTILFEGNSTGGYEPATSEFYQNNVLVMPTTSLDVTTGLYARGKYVATDATESLYSPTFAFDII